MRDGTALLKLANGLRHIVRDGTAEGREFIIYNLKLIVYSLLIGGAWGRLAGWDRLITAC